MRKMRNKIISLLFVIVLFVITAPNAVIADDRIVLSSTDDFISFAQKCKSDIYSQGKVVELKKDIDFSDINFTPIPTFGGTFRGNGHKISGVQYKVKGSYQGLFRYIQYGAVVEGLTLSGVFIAEGSAKYIGGFAGKCSGTIRGCTFSGSVKGESTVGGIAGYVVGSGIITSCKADAAVTAQSYTGGIAGQNYGTVENCESRGSINTVALTEKKSIEDLELGIDNIRSTENVNTATDTGGIAGFSKGRITGCKNYADVGYKHVGYNTGGICGRTSGYISECENHGAVFGRKDVGGICGQQEPYVLLEFTEDTVKELNDILLQMQNTIDSAIDGSDSSLSRTLNDINSSLRVVMDNAQGITDDAVDYGSDITDYVDDLTTLIKNSLNDSGEAFNNLDKGMDSLSAAGEQISEAGEEFSKVSDKIALAGDEATNVSSALASSMKSFERASQRFTDAGKNFENSTKNLNKKITSLKTAVNNLKNNISDKKKAEESFKEIWQNLTEIQQSFAEAEKSLSEYAKILEELYNDKALGTNAKKAADAFKDLASSFAEINQGLTEVSEAVLNLSSGFDSAAFSQGLSKIRSGFAVLEGGFTSLERASDELKDVTNAISSAGDIAGDAFDFIKDAADEMKSGVDYLKKGLNVFKSIADKMSDNAPSMPQVSDEFGKKLDKLFDSIEIMQNNFDKLNSSLIDTKDSTVAKLRDINNDFRQVSDILEKSTDIDDAEIYEDISDKSPSETINGKIEKSKNYGEIAADINCGGIIGSMAIEYDFDPEDDITKSGASSLNFIYKTKAVVSLCENNGKVYPKKRYAGGIVGKMDLGSVIYCRANGEISGDDADFIGGIAGMSESVIRTSMSKCRISGRDYTGGIAGSGDIVDNCFSLVDISHSGEFSGAVLGEESDNVTDCRFVGDTLGGIDGINYSGRAEESDIISFNDYVSRYFGAPPEFTLKFIADGEVIDTVTFEYGEKISEDKIPKVPEKEGFYGVWSNYDFDNAEIDAEIYAEYYEYVSVIESELKRGKRSVVLVCGDFDDDSSIKVTENSERHLPGTTARESYSVKIDDNMGQDSYAVRYAPKGGFGGTEILLKSQGAAKKVKTISFGSYLEFETSENEFVIYEVSKFGKTLIVVLALIFIIAVVFAGIFIAKKRKNFSKKIKK